MKQLRYYLQKELNKKYPLKQVVNDGILVPEIYNNQKNKVLFLLKETFGGYNNIEGPQGIYNGKSSPFWPNIFNWTNLISSNDARYFPKNQISTITNVIDNIAYVNIKKVNENRKKSNEKDILGYAKEDAELLRYQIDQINPDFIFTSDTTLKSYKLLYGSNVEFLKSVGCGRLTFELYKHNERKIIKTFHPSAFPVKQEDAFNVIIDLIKM